MPLCPGDLALALPERIQHYGDLMLPTVSATALRTSGHSSRIGMISETCCQHLRSPTSAGWPRLHRRGVIVRRLPTLLPRSLLVAPRARSPWPRPDPLPVPRSRCKSARPCRGSRTFRADWCALLPKPVARQLLRESLLHRRACFSCRLVRFLTSSRDYKVRASKTTVICLARRASSTCRHIAVVEIDGVS